VQSVKRSVESRQRTSAEVAEYEQQIAQMTEYMRKLQLEYQVLYCYLIPTCTENASLHVCTVHTYSSM
jgi:hypothetical protein